VLVDQFVDRTHKRESSFFGKGCVAMCRWHIRCRDCASISPRQPKPKASRWRVAHLCLHGGPQFSTLAESLTYKGLVIR